MDKRKRQISVLAVALALVLVLGMAAGVIPMQAQAATSSELKAQLNALQSQSAAISAQLAELQQDLSENNSEIEKMVAEKNIIDQEIFLLYQQINNINNQIATYSMLIADKQEELVAAQARYDELLEQNRDRIQAMEEEGEVSYWSVLFQANSFADLLDRLNMIQEIAASDRRRLDELDKAALEVLEVKALLETEKQGLEETRKSLDETQKELEVKREEANALLKDLVARGMEYEALVAESEAARAQLMTSIANTQVQYNNALYQEWLATSVPATTLPLPPSQTEATQATDPTKETQSGETTESGEDSETSTDEGWKVPIDYVQNTSPFGDRDAPTAGASTNHQGVDLAAPENTPIYATRSGTVTIASYSSSAGYYVQIDHGGGTKSIYMHMTYFTVSAGQQVSQGQVIGYCGSTGISTGSHLHFGISQDGVYQNPNEYIPV